MGFIGANVAFIAIVLLFAYPTHAHAFSITDFIKNLFGMSGGTTETNKVKSDPPSRPFAFLSALPVSDPKTSIGAIQLQFVDETSLAAAVGPLGNVVEASESSLSYKISSYTIRKGDTLSAIAESFGVSVSTIRWANDIPRGSSIKEGDVLVILPVSGVKHTIAKGDTINSIAKKYGSDPDDILSFNDLARSDELEVGSVIIVPDGEIAAPVQQPSVGRPAPQYVRAGGPDLGGYYQAPLSSWRKTQGIHGYNGVDLAAPRGTPVYAAASGVVITARGSGWNGGYGKYIAISHQNDTQTLYAHLDSVSIESGWNVARGQLIGFTGSTGKSTGSHLHFEVRGAKNPF